MGFCLPIEQTKKFIQALKDGVIDPGKLATLDSAGRHEFFSKLVGEGDAREVNALFESKLLLKNQQTGMIAWAKKIAGISEATRTDIISKIGRMDRILNETDQKSFLRDLASKRLGTEVTFEEAKKITELSKLISEAKSKLDANEPIGSAARLDYGAKKVALLNYVNELKLSNTETGIKAGVKGIVKNPIRGTAEAISKLAGIAKGIKASLDDSAIFRQGWKTVFTNPKIWAENAVKSFADIAKQLGKSPLNNEVMDGIKADVYSRPNAIDNTYQKMKLDIGTGEEAYPASIPEKIPLFGRLYKASEVAYNGFLMRMRADIADKYIRIAKENGVDLTDPLQMRSIGLLTNSLTGRGSLGSFERVGKQVNTVFFSPKSAKASFDFLTLHAADNMSTFARKQAAINLLKVASGTAVIMGVAMAINPKSVELDPRSSDFGKIRIGNTRFDISGGMSSVITLAARLLTLSSKSTVTGKVTSLNSGKFGSQTGVDVFTNFLENKLSPAASVVKDLMKGQDFQGNKPTLAGETSNLLTPLPITNVQELMNTPNSANTLIAAMADALGIVTNSYAPKKKK